MKIIITIIVLFFSLSVLADKTKRFGYWESFNERCPDLIDALREGELLSYQYIIRDDLSDDPDGNSYGEYLVRWSTGLFLRYQFYGVAQRQNHYCDILRPKNY
jgi:hypothetical protein